MAQYRKQRVFMLEKRETGEHFAQDLEYKLCLKVRVSRYDMSKSLEVDHQQIEKMDTSGIIHHIVEREREREHSG